MQGAPRDFDGAFASAVCSGTEEKLVRTRFCPEAWSFEKRSSVAPRVALRGALERSAALGYRDALESPSEEENLRKSARIT